ncbi:MAG: hypothetical protein HY690_05135 [Chloroflexi bacterium]|nr:hypothetical protein [Chloroflexota bacterium]
MTWRRVRLCFELLSPLHIGFLPNQPGTVVARTRCYVPGKNLWGAVTASITPRLHPNPTAGNYRDVGEVIREQVVFSYFYLSDGAQLFTPDYTENGLVWGNLPDRAFRARFIGSRVSTAIGETGGAEDASLHEIEFVRHRLGSPGQSSQKVLLMGVVWIRQDAGVAHQALRLEDVLSEADIVLGGERNYGFGRVRRVPPQEVFTVGVSDWWPENPAAAIPVDGERPLLGHAPYRQDRLFRGEIEIVAGREYRRKGVGAEFQGPGIEITNAGYCFVPGTCLGGETMAYLDPWGRLNWA